VGNYLVVLLGIDFSICSLMANLVTKYISVTVCCINNRTGCVLLTLVTKVTFSV